ncbi:MAG: hypothetical protein Q7R52_02585 [archaeon]|nr:hypothetical protein [archaeon]
MIIITIIIHAIGFVLFLYSFYFKKDRIEVFESHAFWFGYLTLIVALMMDITIVLVWIFKKIYIS